MWTRDVPAPGPDVYRIFDGVSYYRRTAANRWVPEGQSGPGFAWAEIPAALRVDASRPCPAAPDGSLRVAAPPVGRGSRRRRWSAATVGLRHDDRTTERDRSSVVRRREAPTLDLPGEILDLADGFPVYSATW